MSLHIDDITDDRYEIEAFWNGGQWDVSVTRRNDQVWGAGHGHTMNEAARAALSALHKNKEVTDG